MKQFFKKFALQIIPWALPLLLVVTWQVFSMKSIIPNTILPAPSDVFMAGVSLFQSGEHMENL